MNIIKSFIIHFNICVKPIINNYNHNKSKKSQNKINTEKTDDAEENHKNTHQNESNEKKEENEYMEEPEHGKHKHEHGKHKHKVKFTKLYIIEAVKLKLKEIDTTNLPNNSIDFTQLITKNIIIKSRESIGSLDLTPEQLIYFLLARPKIDKNHENNNDYKKDKHIKLYLKKLIIISLEYVKSKIPIDYYINAITNLVNELEFPNGLKKEIIEILKYPQALLDPIKMQKVINYNNKFFSKKN